MRRVGAGLVDSRTSLSFRQQEEEEEDLPCLAEKKKKICRALPRREEEEEDVPCRAVPAEKKVLCPVAVGVAE